MITKSKTAKVVAGLVGFAFAFSAFVTPVTSSAQTAAELQAMVERLMLQIAALQGTTTVTGSFMADLSVGSSGSDVTRLQQFLVSKGHLTMPVGVAMGYFGELTRSAVAAFQAANSISPAVGYFGPTTRARVNSMLGPVAVDLCPNVAGVQTSLPCSGGSTGTLQGGEASLEDFSLSDEESEGHEGEDDVEIATAEFDVEDGDARIERVEIDFQAENNSLTTRPWDYFDSISLWVDGEMVDEMDVDARGDWDDDDADSDHDASAADWYRITFTGLDIVVEEGETAEITIAANIAGSIDTADQAQDFTILIPDDGIRATDAEGIQQYTGDYDETVDGFGFDAEESGDLDIETNSDDPDTMTLISDEDDESDEYTVFVFDIENNDDADALITDITIDVATSSGDAMLSIIDSATLVVDGDEFDGDLNTPTSNTGTIDFEDIDVEIGGDETLTFELVITLKENAPDSTLDFTIEAADVTAEGVESGDDSDVSGSVSSETHTVSAAGILVEGTGKSTGISEDGDTGTFTLEFTIEALEEDVYIYAGATDASFSASTSGMFYNIYKGGSILTATSTDSAVLQSTAARAGLGNNWFVVESDDMEEFTLTVTLDPQSTASALYSVELDSIRFDDAADTTADDTTFELPNDSEFETNARQIDGN